MPKRRRRGDGSVHQRPDGKWIASLDLGVHIGPDRKRRRRRVKKLCSSEAEALRALRKMLRDRDDGVTPTGHITIEAWLDHWIENIADVKDSTRTMYRGSADRYIKPTIGTIKLNKLTPDDVRGMYDTLATWTTKSRRPLSKSVISGAQSVLRRALNIAMKEGHVSRNVAVLAGEPRVGATGSTYPTLTVEQAQKVIASAKDDPRLRCRLICALVLGIRQGEALGLTWDDVTLEGDTGAVSVRQVAQQLHGQGVVIGTPKSASSVRTVPLPPIAARAFAAWRTASAGHGYVFHGFRGPEVPEGSKRDWQVWTDQLKIAEVPHIPLHGARGSAGSLLLKLGVSPVVIADILGHSTVKVTQDHYLHSDEQQRMAAMQLLSSAIEPATETTMAIALPDQDTKDIRVKLPVDVINRVDDLADHADVTRSAWIAEALTRVVAEIEKHAERPVAS